MRESMRQRGRLFVHVVPEAAGGIRDYAVNLKRMWSSSGMNSEVLPLSQPGSRAAPLWSRFQTAAERGDAIVLITHYSGYGYEPRGLCEWLVRELRLARARLGPALRVATVFHELYASGPPWRSAFWLQHRQAAIAADLAELSDASITNTEDHARWLESRHRSQRRVEVWPVFSNVGEPAVAAPFAVRKRRLVVFGSEPTRRRALTLLPTHTRDLHALGIEECIEVGAGTAVGARSGALRMVFAGRLDEASLSDLLGRTAFGLIEYPTHCIAKSGVFAAYAAHGCVVLNAHASRQPADGLSAGRHFLSLGDAAGAPPADEDLHRMATSCKAWYDRHTLPIQAAALLRVCSAAGSPADAVRRQD